MMPTNFGHRAGGLNSKVQMQIEQPDWMSGRHMTGTSIMAVQFSEGVILGADTRTTTGAYVANRVTDKLTRITDKIYCCRSGSAADTQAIADIVSYHLEFHEIQTGEDPAVKSAAVVFKDLCYQYRDQMSAGILVAGWDKELGGQIYGIPIGGMITRQTVSIGGSGSSYIYGYVDAHYRDGMSKEETAEFVTDALALAIMRDGSSGGCVRLAIITKDGVERRLITGDQLKKFYEGN